MVELSVLIPTHDNAGRKFSAQHHERFQARARELFGGWTMMGETQGEWTDPSGAVVKDTCRRYVVALRSLLDMGQGKEFATFACRHYAQDALYVSALGVAEVYAPNWRGIIVPPLSLDAFEAAA